MHLHPFVELVKRGPITNVVHEDRALRVLIELIPHVEELPGTVGGGWGGKELCGVLLASIGLAPYPQRIAS